MTKRANATISANGTVVNDIVTDNKFRLYGKVYVLGQDIYAQNKIGKLTYDINIGLYDEDKKQLVQTPAGPANITDRDWLTLQFRLRDSIS